MRYMPYDHKEIVARLRHYVEKDRNYRNINLTSAAVAEALGIARSTLIKVMSETMNTTFLDYLTKVRVQRARHFLVQRGNRQTVEHIALLVGFGSLATLNSKYRAAYGELPSETKRRVMEQ